MCGGCKLRLYCSKKCQRRQPCQYNRFCRRKSAPKLLPLDRLRSPPENDHGAGKNQVAKPNQFMRAYEAQRRLTARKTQQWAAMGEHAKSVQWSREDFTRREKQSRADARELGREMRQVSESWGHRSPPVVDRDFSTKLLAFPPGIGGSAPLACAASSSGATLSRHGIATILQGDSFSRRPGLY